VSSTETAAAPPGAEQQRAIKIAAFGTLCLGVLGFMAGTRQAETTDRTRVTPTATVAGEVPLAVRYDEVGESGLAPNAGWSTSLADAPSEPPVYPDAPPSLAEKRAALADRASRRAYAGAPPVIPHRVEDRSAESCMACHDEGLQLGDELAASPMPHAFYTNCLQCHASSPPAALSMEAWDVNNSFQGLAEPEQGSRAWEGAPPVIPHRTTMRENCMACHGPESAYPALRSTHPWRVSCNQCHASSASFPR
jgi:cytochrome c-type protein NapB